MNKKGFLKHIDFFSVDIICLIISYIFAGCVRGITAQFDDKLYRFLIVIEILVFVTTVYFYAPYKSILRKRFTQLLMTSINLGMIQFVLVVFLLFCIKVGGEISRLFIFYEYFTYILISYVFKIIWRKLLRYKAKESVDNGSKSLLIVTTKKDLKELKINIKKYNFEFFRIVGICLIDDDSAKTIEDIEVVCNKDEILKYCCNNWIDSVFFDMDYQLIPEEILNGLATAGITNHLRLMKVEAFKGQDQIVEQLLNTTVLTSCVKERSNRQIILKRFMDICGAIIGCILMFIIALIIAPIIYIKSPGPIFYKQERIGQNGRHFYMYKFRSMIINADAMKKDLEAQNRVKDGMMFKIKDDPRIIPGIGNFIRKTSLDEFPQFINVLKGDMSLVGTRPPTVDEWNKYELQHRIRMAIKPGITGMWQVSGRNQITDFNEVVKLDSYYINNWSLTLDIDILFKTVLSLLKRGSDEAM